VATEGDEGEYEGKAEECGREGRTRGMRGGAVQGGRPYEPSRGHAVGIRRTYGGTRVGIRADGETVTTRPHSAHSCPSLRPNTHAPVSPSLGLESAVCTRDLTRAVPASLPILGCTRS
jgi:hypothetical protein